MRPNRFLHVLGLVGAVADAAQPLDGVGDLGAECDRQEGDVVAAAGLLAGAQIHRGAADRLSGGGFALGVEVASHAAGDDRDDHVVDGGAVGQ